jgi:hypothetical protein
MERLNREIKRRPPRVATVFPNEASLPRLASAEVCEEWETGKIYLNVENRSSPRKQ